MRLVGVLLAGGESRRMGSDKSALAHPRGGTFAAHAMATLRALTDDVYVVGHARHVDPAVPRVVDSAPGSGPRAALADAVAHAAAAGAACLVAVAIDMPEVTAQELQRLVDALSAEVDAVCFTGPRGIEPLPCALRCTPAVERALRTGGPQLRAGLLGLALRTLEVADPLVLRNVNGPADL